MQLVALELVVQPTPDMLVAVKPAGRLAVTVNAPLEAAEPALLMVRVICPAVPRIHGEPVTELVMAKSVPV